MEVVYIDSVFLLNGLLDYLLLLCTAQLSGIPLRRLRYVLGALLGGAYAAATFLPGCGFFSVPPVKVAVGVLMALVAFGCEAHWFRLMCLLFGLACGLAGCVLAVGLLGGRWLMTAGGVLFANAGAGELLLVATLVYGFFSVVFRAAARHRVRQDILPVMVVIGGNSMDLTALADNGCAVTDPVSGQPVMIVAAERLQPLLPQEIQRLIAEERLEHPAEWLPLFRQAAPQLRFFLVPYRAVGTGSGLLLAFRSDRVRIGGTTYERLPVALSPGELGTGFQALWGGMMGKEGIQNGFLGKSPAIADQMGDPAGGNDPLHRRKRHAAAAADTGAGGRTSGPAG